MKDNDNLNRKRIEELTAFYEAQFEKERETNQLREDNLQEFNNNQISILQHVIKAKEEEISRLLAINSDLKQNEEKRLHLIKANNY
jgi:L-lactate utilization protein LutC